MPLEAGTRIGPYEIVSLLGKGGMGEVYRARDTSLRRDVAVKTITAAFASDPARLARFAREAQVLAALNHPNIAQIYGLEDRALILELVLGDSPRGPLPVQEVRRLALQAIDALDYAHERGVIHRDLKPANMKVTPEGTLKLLDFGLAKATQAPVDPDGDPSEAPTVSIHATEAGVVMGTVSYMPPEQARGKIVDKRADIWSFGVVLYELLTGKRPFEGETAADVMSAVVSKDPDWTVVPALFVPLLRRCLVKDPKHRLRDIADAVALLEEAPQPAPQMESRKTAWLPWVCAAAFGLAAAWLGATHFRETRPTPQTVQATIEMPDSGIRPQAVSPDGSKLVYGIRASGANLWVRSLATGETQQITQSDNGGQPFWSPDSKSIAFFAYGKLKRVSVLGGTSVVLADAPDPRGGSWGADGTILFAPRANGPLYRIPAAGGPAVALPTDAQEGESDRFPFFLPDGRHFLFVKLATARADAERQLLVGSLDGSVRKLLGNTQSQPAFVSMADGSGSLLRVLNGSLTAQQLDAKALTLVGEPADLPFRPLIANNASAAYTASDNGLLVWQGNTAAREATLTWHDRQGNVVSKLGEPHNYLSFRISRDGTQVAAAVIDQGRDIWLVSTDRGVMTRGTASKQAEDPVWGPKGLLAVSTDAPLRLGLLDPSKMQVKAGAAPSGNQYPNDWSLDGKYVVYDEQVRTNTSRQNDLYYVTVGPDGEFSKPIPYLTTSFDEWEGRFIPEPNPKWLAYRSNETDSYEVYLQSFPVPGNKIRVSTNGGRFPTWSPDGKELYYVAPDDRLMAVSVKPMGNSLQLSTPQPLFLLPPAANAYPYDVSRDGKRFLVSDPTVTTTPLTIVTNWPSLLAKH